MATVNVIANGPIEFTDTMDATQKSIPISKISFDGTAFHIDSDWLGQRNESDFTPLLARLRTEGLLVPAEAPPPGKAMTITAVDAGAIGNNIQVGFANFKTKAGDIVSFDATVTETITYKNVKPADLKTLLGSSAQGEPKSGLVFVSSLGEPALPQEGDYSLKGNPASSAIDATTGPDPAFELTAKKSGLDSQWITVKIEDATDADFTLIAVWSKIVQAITAKDLSSQFAYTIKVEPPTKDGVLGVPAEGVVNLFGGAEAQTPTAASVVVLAR